MQLTPREFDKLLIYTMADVALKRRAKGLKLNYPEAVAVISAVALDGARAGKTIEDVTKEARTALTKADVMDGVADLIPMVQIEAVFTDGSRLVTVHTPVQCVPDRRLPWLDQKSAPQLPRMSTRRQRTCRSAVTCAVQRRSHSMPIVR
jgi:urease subunit gamma